jgi:starch synthase
LKVLFLAAEVAPFAKTGGLADVAGSLPKALKALGHDISVAMPRYVSTDVGRFALTEVLSEFAVPFGEGTEPARILQGIIEGGVPVYMVGNAKYRDRDGIYLHPDDVERFILLAGLL